MTIQLIYFDMQDDYVNITEVLVHPSRRLKWTIVITHCPSSVSRRKLFTFSTSPLKPLNGIQQNLTEARSQCPLLSLCFSGRSEKQDGRPDLWLAETFSTTHLKLLNGFQRSLTGSKISTSSTKFGFFSGRYEKQDDHPSSDWLRHFRLL